MKNKRIIDTLILIFIFLLLVAFPLDRFISDPLLLKGLEIILRVIGIIVVSTVLSQSKTILNNKDNITIKPILVLAPTFIICFTNLIYLAVEHIDFNIAVNKTFFLDVLFHLTTAILEELIFRKVLFDNIEIKHPLKKIVLLSLIFSGCHLINFLSTLDPSHLLEVAYTFGTGIVMGFLYYYSHSIGITILFHFLYNLMNSVIFGFANISSFTYVYYIVCAIITVIVTINILLFYKNKASKKPC